jgi:hypothetical protein
VQEKPQESEGYFDYDMKKGHIIGTECEFGINDNYHLDIINKLKKTDSISDE